jgi:dolichol-phosphate mannosyltransferase
LTVRETALLTKTSAPQSVETVSRDSHGYELTVVAPTFNESANVAKLAELLEKTLTGVAWQLIFVDDNSPDGTAEVVKAMAARDNRIQCLRRVGRRGLAGAVVEGALASAAPFVAVIDADLQHDEALLPRMLEVLRAGRADLVIASRYTGDGDAGEGLSAVRERGSRFANWLGRMVLRQHVSDPVSGFFMVRRPLFERVAPKLSTEGFKILFDLIASQPEPLTIVEMPYTFREREAGGSKLDKRIVIDYLGLLLSKVTGGVVPTRALLFGLVGASGVLVYLAAFNALRPVLDLTLSGQFTLAQMLASMVAMTTNYLINNEVTYRDRRQRGLGLLVGYAKFCALCSIGLIANLAVATLLHQWIAPTAAGLGGVVFGALWNYVSTAAAVW